MDDEKIKARIGSNIASFRKAAGLTQAGLAEKLNYSDKAISKWERGESVPDVLTLMQRIPGSWVAFVYAIPVNAIVLLSLRSAWGMFSWNRALISVIVWGSLTSLYISLLVFTHANVWKLFLLGIPGQIAIFLWFRMFRKPARKAAEQEETQDGE